MQLFIEIIEGPAKGMKVQLKRSSSLGRSGTDVSIEDPKLSQIHAFLQYEKDKGWFLQDNSSRNGVWVKGIREHKIKISDGMKFQIGQNTILCLLVKKSSRGVGEAFLDWLETLRGSLKDEKLELVEIKPEMRLKVISGQQMGETWDIFYGPRFVGKDNEDVCLYDDLAPSEAFEIRVKRRYPYFHTKHEAKVKINSESKTDKQLRPGDIIQVGESEILVEFDSGHGFHS